VSGDSTVGHGSAWSTGIAEVSLPLDFKLKNIEATEAARKRLEEERRLLRSVKERQLALVGGAARAQRDTDNGERYERSTDDAVAQRFQKQQYRRLR
jgi:hypothetical protein